MDQDLEKEDGGLVGGGGADTWAQCQPCRATSNRRLFPLSFPGPEHSADEAKKTSNNAAIQHVVSLLPQQTQHDVKTFEK